MIMVRIYDDATLDTDYVRCPLCGKGRLCDKPKSHKVTIYDKCIDKNAEKEGFIVLKCPKCSVKSIIQFTRE